MAGLALFPALKFMLRAVRLRVVIVCSRSCVENGIACLIWPKKAYFTLYNISDFFPIPCCTPGQSLGLYAKTEPIKLSPLVRAIKLAEYVGAYFLFSQMNILIFF